MIKKCAAMSRKNNPGDYFLVAVAAICATLIPAAGKTPPDCLVLVDYFAVLKRY
jgi:hypothetical protein